MKFQFARQVIHDAFMNDVKGVDLGKRCLEFGIQFTAKGGDGKTLDHCDKGIIQQALAIQRVKDPVSWAWNMFAYTPPDTAGTLEKTLLLNWLVHRVNGATWDHLALARIAMHDISIQDRRESQVRRRKAAMAATLGVDEEEYQQKWHAQYQKFRARCLALPEKSLPPIARVVYLVVHKQHPDPAIAKRAHEDLLKALKMPASSV